MTHKSKTNSCSWHHIELNIYDSISFIIDSNSINSTIFKSLHVLYRVRLVYSPTSYTLLIRLFTYPFSCKMHLIQQEWSDGHLLLNCWLFKNECGVYDHNNFPGSSALHWKFYSVLLLLTWYRAPATENAKKSPNPI